MKKKKKILTCVQTRERFAGRIEIHRCTSMYTATGSRVWSARRFHRAHYSNRKSSYNTNRNIIGSIGLSLSVTARATIKILSK